MTMFTKNEKTRKIKGGVPYMMIEHRGFARPIPPHERKLWMPIEFNEDDWNLLQEVFDDEDTASAVIEIIQEAPPEIQILAIQLINLIKEVE